LPFRFRFLLWRIFRSFCSFPSPPWCRLRLLLLLLLLLVLLLLLLLPPPPDRRTLRSFNSFISGSSLGLLRPWPPLLLLLSCDDVADACDDADDNDSCDRLMGEGDCGGDGNGDSAGRKGWAEEEDDDVILSSSAPGDDPGDERLSDVGGCGSSLGPSFISAGKGGDDGCGDDDGLGGSTGGGGDGTGDGCDDDDKDDDDDDDEEEEEEEEEVASVNKSCRLERRLLKNSARSPGGLTTRLLLV
jgi:hypothetical protein